MTLERIGKYFRLMCAIACLSACSALAAAEFHGQVTFGGFPLPGATVTATQGDKKFVAVTDENGVFSFPDFPDGTWTLEIEMTGFEKLKQDVQVGPNLPQAPPMAMKLLSLDQINAPVQVKTKPVAPPPITTAPPANSAPAKVSGNAATAKVATPANAANAPGNQTAAPGGNAAAPGAKATPTEDPLAQASSDGFLINGSQNNGAASPFAQIAAFGNNRNNGRSLYNGSIGVILDNSALDARPFSLTGFDTPKTAYNNLTGVATLGGPLQVPHVFKRVANFFAGYQWTRNTSAVTQSAVVPTMAERDGNLAGETDGAGNPIKIYNPATGLPFTGNMVPVSPQAQALLNLYPAPNLTGNPVYNFQTPIVTNTHTDAMQTRFDRSINRKNQVNGTFNFLDSRTSNPNLFGFIDSTDVLGINTAASWIHHFTQRVLMTLTYTYSYQSTNVLPFWANRENISGMAGITGNNQEPTNWGPPTLSFASATPTLSDGISAYNRNQTSAISPAVSWYRVRHSITFGMEFRRQEFNYLSQQNPRGSFTFTGAATQGVQPFTENGQPVTEGSPLADFLLGIPDTSAIAFGNADKYFRQSVYAAYVNDDWKVRPGFTMSLGLRWEYGAPATELFGRLVNLDITPGFTAVAPVKASSPVGPLTNQIYPTSLVHPDKHGIEPRMGIAWRPISGDSLVVRSGYSITYDTSVYSAIASKMAQQAPLSESLSVSNSATCPLTLAMGFNPCSTTTADGFAIDPNFRVGYAQNWYLTLQRELPGSLVLSVSYQGTKGTRGPQEFLPNTFPIGATNPCPTCPAGFAFITSNGNSTREAGIVQLRRRLHNGFTATMQYTFSKSIDDDSAFGGQGAAVSGSIAQNWLNLNGERGLSTFDQRHLFTSTLQYTTGMGSRGGTLMGGWRGRAYKEWTVQTVVTVGSGLPQTPTFFAAVPGTGYTGTIRPDTTGLPIYTAPAGLFLNPAAFAPPVSGQFGTAGRDSITGPDQFSLNASMSRTFRLEGRFNLDLRFDSTNLLNHVVYTAWYTTINSSEFGLPASYNPMRSIRTTLRLRF